LNSLLKASALSSMAPSMTAAASAGMIPTIDRTLTGTGTPDGVISRS
jgi:hypothetical protein